MYQRWFFSAALLAAAIVPIRADAEMPHYDVEAYCRRIATVGGPFSESTMQSCLQMEQSAYDALKPGWDALPAHVRAYCDEIARVGGPGSFSTLQSCVQMEQNAGQSNRTFHFQR